MDSQSIEAYFEKILQIKNQRKGLSQSELKEIALDLGMSEAEWREVQNVARGHIERGYNFLEHQNEDDAQKEFEQALLVFPDDAPALYGVAHIHERRFMAKGKAADKETALKYAHAALQTDPAHTEAARLISYLKDQKPITTWHKVRKPVFLLLVLAVLAGVVYKYQGKIKTEIDHIKEAFQARKGAQFVLHEVYFESGSTELHDARSEEELMRLVSFLKKHPKLKGEIAGHTDNTGRAAANLQISTQRAYSVYKYLTKNGVKPAQLIYRGYGATRPKFPNNNPVNRRKNRRIEFKILKVR
ncbi:OmpA family protein [Microscilla marina]|uniref:OmpA family protein n=1 Tax=Microscilla marina ATCC 23134 TaxID=313606 RepID=A1ZLU0_MICM2|nr:OmpA family protein [Microscilla marina]EAY28844.1 OmpA family protein [Microscilla marina ATCC 23134]